MTSSKEIVHDDSVERDAEDGKLTEDEISSSSSLLIVVVSLLFVAIFGGALVGGVVSGDPTGSFFITVIVASGVAISVALGVSIRYYLINHAKKDDEYLSKEDVRGTFSNSDDENHQEREYFDRHQDHSHLRTQSQLDHYPTQIPIESRIKDIQAKSVFGDMSALSPQTYDEQILTTLEQGRRGLFDFSSITSKKLESNVNVREDPPEGVGSSTFQYIWNTRGHSQDPSAPKFSTDGGIITDEERDTRGQLINDNNNMNCKMEENSSEDHSTASPKRKLRSRYDIESKIDLDNLSEKDSDENTVVMIKNDRYDNSDCGVNVEDTLDSEIESSSKSPSRRSRRHRREHRRSCSRSRSKSKSPSGSRIAKSPSSSAANLSSSKRKLKLKITDAIRLPSSTKSGTSNSMGASSVPPTPAVSETGSFASSFLKPLNGMFGKNKKTSSDAGVDELGSARTTTTNKDPIVPVGNSKKGRPPMMPSNNKGGEGNENIKGTSTSRRGLETIGGRIGRTPSTPGNNSTFSIPPARRIPQTPNGSEVFSEFQSVAGSVYSNGVASSTFDPQAHQRALQKMQKTQASLGAKPLGGNAMHIYYEDDDKESSIAPSAVLPSDALAYDVFAPPGAIGIVVDTHEKGCIVHSLKKSSPMQGLMNRGDLIIALDDFDVRNMSAASLTKLMAKKSQQAERKFTLIPSDFFQ